MELDVKRKGVEMAEDGKTPYTHTAYSWSTDGADGFTTVYPGENILTGTGYYSVAGKSGSEYLSNETNNDLLTIFKGLEGETVTISVDYEYSGFVAGSSQNRLGWEMKVTTDSTVYFSSWYYPNNGSGSGRMSSTFAVPKNITEIGYATGYIQFSGTGTGTLSHLKLEKGSLATPWTPSPLDDLDGAYPKFIGTYTDYISDDSTDPAKYTWAQYVDRSKQKLAVHPKTGADTIGVVGAKLVDLITSDLGNDVSIKLGDYKVYYIDTDGNKSDMVDVPAFTANPSIKPTAIKISQATMGLTEGGNKVLSATITPDTATDKSVTYTSSAPEVAKVSATGEVTAVAEGKADITVASKMVPTITGKCAVTVTPAS